MMWCESITLCNLFVQHTAKNRAYLDTLLDPEVVTHGLPVLRTTDVEEPLIDSSFHGAVKNLKELCSDQRLSAAKSGEKSRLQLWRDVTSWQSFVPGWEESNVYGRACELAKHAFIHPSIFLVTGSNAIFELLNKLKKRFRSFTTSKIAFFFSLKMICAIIFHFKNVDESGNDRHSLSSFILPVPPAHGAICTWPPDAAFKECVRLKTTPHFGYIIPWKLKMKRIRKTSKRPHHKYIRTWPLVSGWSIMVRD